MSEKNTRRLTLADMIQCPFCHAMSYPRVIKDPKTEEEKKAIICGSCQANLRPYVEAMQKYEEKMKKEWEEKNPKNSIQLENDEGIVESYPNADQIMAEVLTDEGN